jgi:zinc protease
MIMRVFRHSVAAAVALLVQVPAAQSSSSLPQIPLERLRLANGLEVILAPDHSKPTVVVDVWYKVGSGDEALSRAGLAHLFEHVALSGSEHAPYGTQSVLTDAIGGHFNGETTEDVTKFFAIIPSNHLERILWFESDRMGFLLPALDSARFETQRSVVMNELRQGSAGNRALMRAALFGPGHPYSWPTGGYVDELRGATLADARAFYRMHYSPSAAALAIVGDFEPADARRWVEKYFGGLPGRAVAMRPAPSVTSLAARRQIIVPGGRTAEQVDIVWPTTPIADDDAVALGALARLMVQPGLLPALANTSGPARSVQADQVSLERAGYFHVLADMKPGRPQSEVERRLNSLLARISDVGPTPAEMEQTLGLRESRFVSSLQDPYTIAELLLSAEVFRGDAGRYRAEAERERTVTAEDIRRVARRYLGPNRLVVHFIAPGNPEYDSLRARSETAEQTADGRLALVIAPPVGDAPDRSVVPPVAPEPRWSVPRIQRSRLRNGTAVALVEDHSVPLVTVQLATRARRPLTGGQTSYRGGLAIAAILAGGGTVAKTKEELYQVERRLGTTIFVGADLMRVTSLRRNFEPSLDLFADHLLNFDLSEQSLRKAIDERKQFIAQARRPQRLVDELFNAKLNGMAPMSQAEADSVRADDVRRAFAELIRPDQAEVVVVGDIDMPSALTSLNRALGSWMNPSAGNRASATKAPANPGVYLVNRAATPQAFLTMGLAGPMTGTREYYAALVLNAIAAGGSLTSRLNAELRERRGVTYFVSSAVRTNGPRSVISISTSIDSAQADSGVAILFRELKALGTSRPATVSEMAEAKRALTKAFPLSFRSTDQAATTIADAWRDGLDDSAVREFASRIEAVSAADVQAVAARYFDPSKMITVIVGDAAALDARLRGLITQVPVVIEKQ